MSNKLHFWRRQQQLQPWSELRLEIDKMLTKIKVENRGQFIYSLCGVYLLKEVPEIELTRLKQQLLNLKLEE